MFTFENGIKLHFNKNKTKSVIGCGDNQSYHFQKLI